MENEIVLDLRKRMDGALHALKHSLNGLRTGRAAASLFDPIKIEAYGNYVPINQIGTVSVPESKMITVQVWDKSQVSLVEKAIRESGLGLNPMSDGNLVRVPIPDLSEERRKELAKKAHEYCEHGKVAIRNIRRDGMETFKKREKDKQISEDECHTRCEEVQKLTDDFIKKAEQAVTDKEKEIMTV